MARKIKEYLTLGLMKEPAKSKGKSKNLIKCGTKVVFNSDSKYFKQASMLDSVRTLKQIVSVNMACYLNEDIRTEKYYEKYFKDDFSMNFLMTNDSFDNGGLTEKEALRTNKRLYLDYLFDGLMHLLDSEIEGLNSISRRYKDIMTEDDLFIVAPHDLNNYYGAHRYSVATVLKKDYGDTIPEIALLGVALIYARLNCVIQNLEHLGDVDGVSKAKHIYDLVDYFFTDTYNYFSGKVPTRTFMKSRIASIHTFLSGKYENADDMFAGDESVEYLYELLLDMETLFVDKLRLNHKKSKRGGIKKVVAKSILKDLMNVNLDNSYKEEK